MSINASKSERWRYRVDHYLDKGAKAIFLALLLIFLVTMVLLILIRLGVLALEMTYTDFQAESFANEFFYGVWVTFLQLTDPGNMSQDNATWLPNKVSAVLAGMSGVVIFSALIAFFTTALDQAIQDLKKGHSRVLESGHTLIIGWGVRVPEILRELIEANESEDDPVVVVLADVPKEGMDQYLTDNLVERRNTRIVTRSGSTSSLVSLKKVAAERAKSVIVLASCDQSATRADKLSSDAIVIKTVLALTTSAQSNDEVNIVAEVFEARNRAIVKNIAVDQVSVVDTQEILAKIMVQTSRTSGLSVVYSELLSFDGCELYFYQSDWEGIAFGDLQFHFEDGVPIGVRSSDGTLALRAPSDYVMRADDEVLIVADDDSTISFLKSPSMRPETMVLGSGRLEPKAERMLVLGWGPKAGVIIDEYSEYVLEGSQVDVVLQDPSAENLSEIRAIDAAHDRLTVLHHDKNPLSSEDLHSMDPFSYNTIIVLSQKPKEGMDPEVADAETIVVLLHLRSGRPAETEHEIHLITEVLNSDNQDLISEVGVNDFIISNRMVSMIFAQISEEPDIQSVYDDLFQEEGSELYVKPAKLYFDSFPVTCRFGDLMHHARRRGGEICIGVKLKEREHCSAENFGVQLIPSKTETFTLGPDDALVVLAEDDT